MPQDGFLPSVLASLEKSYDCANIQVGFRQTGMYPINPNTKSPALPGLSRATDNIVNLSDEGKDNLCGLLHSS